MLKDTGSVAPLPKVRPVSGARFDPSTPLQLQTEALICDVRLCCLPNGAIMQATPRDKEARVPISTANFAEAA